MHSELNRRKFFKAAGTVLTNGSLCGEADGFGQKLLPGVRSNMDGIVAPIQKIRMRAAEPAKD